MEASAPVFGESLALEMLGFLGPDAAEGVAAVRERRSPEFPSAIRSGEAP
jgi:enoyl-CoA hydratase